MKTFAETEREKSVGALLAVVNDDPGYVEIRGTWKPWARSRLCL